MIALRFIAICLLVAFSQAFACVVIDDAGNTVQLDQPARRIISLAPDITETLFAIGAGDRIVGAVSHSDYPSAAKKIMRVGSYAGIDLEKIVALNPDLIVIWGDSFSRQSQALKRLGIPVYQTLPRQLEDIPRNMQHLGCLTGTNKAALLAADTFSHTLKQLQKQYHRETPVSVFYLMGGQGLMTVNQNSWISQVITLCGGRNIFASAKTTVLQVGWEDLVMANPEIILSDAKNANWMRRFSARPQLTAAKKNRMYAIDPDLLDRAGPRLVNAATKICDIIVKYQK